MAVIAPVGSELQVKPQALRQGAGGVTARDADQAMLQLDAWASALHALAVLQV